ncbi:helix-turn-helix transcriptional regulator [Aliarcobacter butzleri]|uniref:helix-turn-helix transcriptional regulator n=1 Tax=Aliarcobacter butzleri TaxID=28197 RepID=UPI002B24B7D1|nr:helix-turn-helix domain-containing protein [Aliarcobacter butzleri]
MNKEIKKKYRAKELALYIGVGLSTIWRWTKEGKIRSQKISRGVTVFDIDEVKSDLKFIKELV